MINEKANRRQPSVKVNNSNDLSNKSSSSDSSSSGSLSSSAPSDSRRIGPTNSLTIRKERKSSLSALDKLIEEHLSLHAQLGDRLDTSKIDLDLLVNSFAGNQFKQPNLHPASNQSASSLDKLKSEPKTELKPESKHKFRFQFFRELPNSPPSSEELNARVQELALTRTKHQSNRSKRSVPGQSNRRAKRSTDQFYFNAYDEALPASYPRKKDWRASNAISEIDNQGVCGACWAHSTLETIESMAGKLSAVHQSACRFERFWQAFKL